MNNLKKRKRHIFSLIVLAGVSLTPLMVFGNNNGNGSITIENPIQFDTIGEFLTALTNLLIYLGVALVVLMVVIGGFYIMISGGDPTKVSKGINTIKWTIVGLFVALFARAILALIEFTIGGGGFSS